MPVPPYPYRAPPPVEHVLQHSLPPYRDLAVIVVVLVIIGAMTSHKRPHVMQVVQQASPQQRRTCSALAVIIIATAAFLVLPLPWPILITLALAGAWKLRIL